MASFEEAFKIILKSEGGYVNHPNDKGNETNFGITLQVAIENGYLGEMKNLSIEIAKEIYRKKYWDKIKLDNIKSQIIANKIFDIAVNQGVGTSSKYVQISLNIINRNNKDYKNLIIDGIIGNMTINALNQTIENNFDNEILSQLKLLQIERYMLICKNDNSQKIFLYGWLNRALY